MNALLTELGSSITHYLILIFYFLGRQMMSLFEFFGIFYPAFSSDKIVTTI